MVVLQTHSSSFLFDLTSHPLKYYRHEASLRKENQKLMNTLEDYKRKNEKLSEEMLDSTRPIVKQLEEEIAKRNAAAALWEKQERELSTTISLYFSSDSGLVVELEV